MTTKEQERKALEQIRKIVAGLGEDSYIGTAFEGCFEIAESNIENDFGESMLDRAEHFERKELEAREKLAQMDGEMILIQRALEENKDIASKRGDRIEVTMTVVDGKGGAVPALLPVEVRLFDSAGREIDGGGYVCAEGGVAKVSFITNVDDADGAYRLVCKDRASGLVKELSVAQK